ncbi:MAG TPA: glucuronate isomerase, partial [Candidatus Hydrogenedentes bacterium]|nr:glucuronate isomerase [Candidatus Hydrogenedentota bacterium]
MDGIFIKEDFLLDSEEAQLLYHTYARDLPIIDYHCHLPPAQIANNHQFRNMTEIWLAGDHYKWRAMRANGVEERYCTGDATDREKFDKILEQCSIPRPAGKTVFTLDEALQAASELGYPVLVRPSYVLGGQGMEIAYNDNDIAEFMGLINKVKQEHPILIDKYMMGKELEVDAICDGE